MKTTVESGSHFVTDWLERRMGKPGRGTTVLKTGWFYDGIYLEGDIGDAHRKPEDRSPKATLLVSRAQVRRGPSGKLRTVIDTDAIEFPDDAAMVEWIEENDAQELPPEADGRLGTFVPEGFEVWEFDWDEHKREVLERSEAKGDHDG